MLQRMTERKRIGVVFGGRSSEREVSLMGGRNVYFSLDRHRYEPLAVYWDQRGRFWSIPETIVIRNTTKEVEDRLTNPGVERITFESLPERIDLAFLVTHGKYGDDGCLQGLLELLRLPYTGSGVLGAALGLDKVMQRKLLRLVPDIGLPQYVAVLRSQWPDTRGEVTTKILALGLPLVVKPSREGSTFGVHVVHHEQELAQALAGAFVFDNEVIAEEYLTGKEFSCIVMGNDEPVAWLPTETEHSSELFTYEEKYLPGGSKKITPIRVADSVITEIQRQAVLTCQALGLVGYARIDGFVTVDDRVLITDPNGAASTGLGPSSWTFHQAAAAGLSVADFLSRAIELGFAAHARKRGPL